MLSIQEPLTRRGMLRVGSLGLGSLALSHLLAEQSAGSESLVRDRSVIFLYLHGGPSQFETFDPKMSAPAGIRSVTGEIPTALPGVTFGSTFQRLAPLADKLAIVRSYRSGGGNHDIKPVVGQETAGANLGSLYARVAGANHPHNGMPRNVLLEPRCVDPETQAGVTQFGRFDAVGPLGSSLAPFRPGGGGVLQEDMTLSLPPERLDDRRSLLQSLDQLRRGMDAAGAVAGMDRFQQQAFQTIVGGVAKAFDLTHEDARTIARYDTAPLVRPEQISKRWNNYQRYVDNAKTLGKLLLLARRLCEAGCGFVTVTTNFVWDMHADANNATIGEGMQYCGRPLDHALSAFIEDCESRGLADKIMLVATGEMGRTPKVNARGGRDHWGGLTPLLLYGGGIQAGQVIGHSTRDGGQPASEPMTGGRLVSTIMHRLLDLGELRTLRGVPADVSRAITASEPIPGLF